MEEFKQEEEEIKKDKEGYMSKNKRMKEDFEAQKHKIDELSRYEKVVQSLH